MRIGPSYRRKRGGGGESATPLEPICASGRAIALEPICASGRTIALGDLCIGPSYRIGAGRFAHRAELLSALVLPICASGFRELIVHWRAKICIASGPEAIARRHWEADLRIAMAELSHWRRFMHRAELSHWSRFVHRSVQSTHASWHRQEGLCTGPSYAIKSRFVPLGRNRPLEPICALGRTRPKDPICALGRTRPLDPICALGRNRPFDPICAAGRTTDPWAANTVPVPIRLTITHAGVAIPRTSFPILMSTYVILQFGNSFANARSSSSFTKVVIDSDSRS